MSQECREALAALAPRAIERLKELLESEDGRVAFAASQAVLDRVFGRAAKVVDEDDDADVPPRLSLTPEQALAIVQAGLRNGVASASERERDP